MSNWYLYWIGYAIVVGTLLLACIVVIAKSLADLYFAMYGREGRPSEPDLDTRVWYRDWECCYSHEAGMRAWAVRISTARWSLPLHGTRWTTTWISPLPEVCGDHNL